MALIRNLRLYAEELNQYPGKKQQRLSFIKLYQYLAQFLRNNSQIEDEERLLLSMLIFELEYLKGTNRTGLPRKGRLYQQLKRDINRLIDHQLNNEERLILLCYLYEKMQLIPDSVINANWPAGKKAFLTDIHHCLAAVVAREKERVSLVIHGEPRVELLEQSINSLLKEYQRARAGHMHLFENKKRLQLIDFIQIINKTCHEIYNQNTFQPNIPRDFYYLATCHIRLGERRF